MVTQPRPNTGFIWHPDKWSFIVALVAGAAGALALAIQKTATMVGVFISVTTVPAAGNLALGLAVGNPEEIAGSLAQLGINIVGMIISGTLLLLVVRTSWPWITTHTERLLGLRPWRVSRRGEVARGVVGAEAETFVEHDRAGVVGLHVQPGRRRAEAGSPVEQLDDDAAWPGPGDDGRDATSTVWMPDPVAVQCGPSPRTIPDLDLRADGSCA